MNAEEVDTKLGSNKSRLSLKQSIASELSDPIDIYFAEDYTSITSFLRPDINQFSTALSIKIEFKPNSRIGLGLGLSVIDSKVVVTGYKFDEDDECVGKQFGLLIGDIITSINGILVSNSIEPIKDAIQQLSLRIQINQELKEQNDKADLQVTKRTSRIKKVPCENEFIPHLMICILRKTHPESTIPAFVQFLHNDNNFEKAFKQQTMMYEEEVQNLACNRRGLITNSSNMKRRKSLDLIQNSPSSHAHMAQSSNSCIGVLLDMLLKCSHPFAVTEEWFQTRQELIESIMTCMHMGQESTIKKNSSDNSLLALVVKCTLNFERSLTESGNIMLSEWRENRRFSKWRFCTVQATTFSQLSLCLAILNHSIDYSRLNTAGKCITRKAWIESTQSTGSKFQFFSSCLPSEGTSLIYYGDGHNEVVQKDKLNHLPSMWGYSCPPITGAVHQCVVRGVRVLLCGPVDSDKCYPFAQIDLQITNPNLSKSSTTFIPTTGSIDEKGLIFRNVNSIVNILIKSPEAVPFLHPVSKFEHPEYESIINQPIHLTHIQKLAREGYYDTYKDLQKDLLLLRDNCRRFCHETYPSLVELVDRLYEEFLALLDLFESQNFMNSNSQSQISQSIHQEIQPIVNSEDSSIQMVADLSGEVQAISQESLSVDKVEQREIEKNDLLEFDTSAQILECEGSLSENEPIRRGRKPRLSSSETSQPFMMGTALKGINLVEGSFPTIGDGFTVCIRLGVGFETYGQFLVDSNVYKSLPRGYRKFQRISSQINGGGTKMGVVVDCKQTTENGLLPWKCLKIDWSDGQENEMYSNPWNIEILKTRQKRG